MDYPSLKVSDYPIGRYFVISAKDLKGASVVALRRLSDYLIQYGSDYPIAWIFHCFNEEKRKDPVLQLIEGTRIIRV